ncbi:MAG: T9SS type A sorting domain-containing protein [Bacteroidales bacterium]|nr:T9SS type A sorting domain-containing protein [Bacteroidales bacterium]
MKKTIFILSIMLTAFAVQSLAQICNPSCTPDVTCIDELGPGEVCPLVLPVAHIGEYYDETVTVIPPATFEIAGSQQNIYQIKIDDVQGLPNGMDWCKSEEFFLVTNPATRYCCQLTGTPDQVGEYQLTLYITPYYNFFGTPTALPQQTDDTSLVVIVLPALPEADFTASTTTTTTGAEVVFTDESTNNPTGWAWAFEGGTPPSSPQQNPTVTYAAEGVYDVTLVVSNDGGSDEITMYDYITIDNGTGINDNLTNNVKLYPNPATNQISVEAEGLKSVSVIDMLGKVVFTVEAIANKETIDISSLGKANYFVKVVTTDGEITKSISIK